MKHAHTACVGCYRLLSGVDWLCQLDHLLWAAPARKAGGPEARSLADRSRCGHSSRHSEDFLDYSRGASARPPVREHVSRRVIAGEAIEVALE